MYERIVIKVGTKVLSAEDGTLDRSVMRSLVGQIATVRRAGAEVVLVTSGAVGAGRGLINLTKSDKLAQKQVFAAVGQVRLMSVYAELFAKEGIDCAQVLATKEDFRDRSHYLNMRTCFENILASGVIPVVNENDVVATAELLFTDNDELAGLVASQLNADAVIILTSVDGFLTLGDDGEMHIVPEIDAEGRTSYQSHISSSKTDFGRGGMLTKFRIAKRLASQGIVVHLANGRRKNVLSAIVTGEPVGTKFVSGRAASSLKRRIAYSDGLATGSVIVNERAAELLRSNERIMSVLPVGVVAVSGEFAKGDVIEILDERKKPIGFGVAEYSAARAREFIGAQHARPVIHYDHLFII